MSLDADHIVDRRRMRRKLTFWRVLAVLLAVGAVVAVTAHRAARRSPTAAPNRAGHGHGLIRNDQERTKALDRLAKSSAQGRDRARGQPRRHHSRCRATA